MNRRSRREFINRILDVYQVDSTTKDLIIESWEQDISVAYEEGHDRAAESITQKLQDCIPAHARNVPEAQVQGAWRDAAKVAYNFIGRRNHTRTNGRT